MDVIWTLVMGGIVGWLASLVMKTDAQQGLVANVVIGVLGAFLGSWLYGALFNDSADSFLGRLVVSVAGAAIVIWLWQVVSKKPAA